jgi:hypothetical protein
LVSKKIERQENDRIIEYENLNYDIRYVKPRRGGEQIIVRCILKKRDDKISFQISKECILKRHLYNQVVELE